MTSEGDGATYDAFISYSQRADGQLAPLLQRSLERLSRPWYRRKPYLRVVRDATTFGATSNLSDTITEALDGAGHLVLLVSPDSVASPWTNLEIEHWLATKGADSITVVITHWAVDDDRADGQLTPLTEFDWDGDDLPAPLHEALDVPLAVDLRWVDDPDAMSLDDERWRDSVAQIAAAVQGRDKDELVGELVSLETRARILTGSIAAGALILLGSIVLAGFQWWYADRQADQARAEQVVAEQQRDTARDERDTALDERDNAEVERDTALDERDAAQDERDAAEVERDTALGERDTAEQERDQARTERDDLLVERDVLSAEVAAEQLVADSRRLASESVLFRDDQPDLALLLGLAAQLRTRQAQATAEVDVSLTEPAGVLLDTLVQAGVPVSASIDIGSAFGPGDGFGLQDFGGPAGGDVFVTGGSDGSVRLWTVAGFELTQLDVTFAGDPAPCEGQTDGIVASIDLVTLGGSTWAVTGAGSQAAVGNEFCPQGGQARLDLWEVVDDGARLVHRDAALIGQGWVGAVAIDHHTCSDGDCPLAVAGIVDGDRRLWTWDISGGSLDPLDSVVRNGRSPSDFARQVSWSAPGALGSIRAIAVTSLFQVELYDATRPHTLRTATRLQAGFDLHLSNEKIPLDLLTSGEWHPSDALLLTTDEAGVVRVHDFHPDAGVVVGRDPVVVLPGPGSAFNTATWHPSLPLVIAGSTDRDIWIWDVTKPTRPRRLLPPLVFHDQPVDALGVSADGQLLLSGSTGSGLNRLVVSLVGSDAIAQAACVELNGRELTIEELSLFLGDATLVELCR